MRNTLLATGAAALVCGSTVIAFFSGGYFDRPRVVAALAAWAAVALAAVLAPRPLPASPQGRAALAGLVLLCVWTGLSITWAPIAGRAQDDLQRVVLYLGFFVAAVALLRAPAARRWLEPGVVLGAFVIVAYGLSERLLPDLVELDRSFASAGRLEQPLTYWNGLGIVAAVGSVLAIRVAGTPERPAALRAAAAVAGVPLLLGTYLTFARGALAALALGVVMLLALAPAGRQQLRAIAAIGVAAAIAALVASNLHGVKSLEARQQGNPDDGLLMLVVLVVLALIAVIVAAGVAVALGSDEGDVPPPPPPTTAAPAAAGASTPQPNTPPAPQPSKPPAPSRSDAVAEVTRDLASRGHRVHAAVSGNSQSATLSLTGATLTRESGNQLLGNGRLRGALKAAGVRIVVQMNGEQSWTYML
jgi:hypothetical protein